MAPFHPPHTNVTEDTDMPAAKKTVARSAKTGKLVSKAEAKAKPETTVVEAVKPAKIKIGKIPTGLGACADLLYRVREERLNMQRDVKEYEDFEKELKRHLIDNLPKSDATGAAGKVARVQIEVEAQPVVEDWDKFYTHIKKKGEFDLLNRAVNRAAVRERWDAGKPIPGVGKFNATKVSVTKVR